MAPEKAREIESWLRFAEDDWAYAQHGQQDFPHGAPNGALTELASM